jgi:hypothetical protein
MKPELESKFANLICYTVTSARGLLDEPNHYSSSRLLETSRRLVDLASDCGIHSAVLSEIAERIERERIDAMHSGRDAFASFMDELVETLAEWRAASATG